MGGNSFEYKEMLAIISRVRWEEKETGLRYRRLFFPVFPSVFEYHENLLSFLRYMILLLRMKNGIIDYYVKDK